MKRIHSVIYTLLTAAIILASGVGCSRRTQISDEMLAQIFHDSFLANAYTSERGISLDSLRLYEPIFNKYGYTTDDVQYTIGSFATRKSARLSDVVERAIAMLERRGEILDKHIEVLNSIDEMAKSRSAEIVYSDSLLRYDNLNDSMSLLITLDSLTKGSYHLTFDYLVDSMDRTSRVYMTHSWVERDERVKGKDGGDSIVTKKLSNNSQSLRRGVVLNFENTRNIDNTGDRMVIELLSNNDRDSARSVTIKNIELRHTFELESAREKLYQHLLGFNIFDDELLFE